MPLPHAPTSCSPPLALPIALGLALASLAAAPATAWAQDDDGRRIAGTVRMGGEYDDNALRLEGDRARSDVVARYFASLAVASRAIPNSLATLDVDHGGKFFAEQAGADTLLTQLQLGYQQRLWEHLGGYLALEMKDRTERVSQRDYNRGGLGAGVDVFAGPVHVRAGGAWRYFAYKPNPESSSSNVEGSLRLRYALLESLFATGGYTFARRSFDTPPLEVESEEFGIAAISGETREDTFHVAFVGVGYRGPLVVDASYAYAVNASNSFGQGLTRHGFDLTITLPLVWDFFASAHLELQRTAYDDPVLIDASFIVDEDNRNALVTSLARPFFEDWEVELRHSLYLQEFGVGSDYQRQTLLLAVGYLFDT